MIHALNILTRDLFLKEMQLREPMHEEVKVERTRLLNEQIASIKQAIELLSKEMELQHA